MVYELFKSRKDIVLSRNAIATADSIADIRKKAVKYLSDRKVSTTLYILKNEEVFGQIRSAKITVKEVSDDAKKHGIRNGKYLRIEYWPNTLEWEFYLLKKDGSMGVKFKEGSDGKLHPTKKGSLSTYNDYHWYLGQK